MGVYVKFSRSETAPPNEKAFWQDYWRFITQSMDFYQDWFTPKSIETWLDAPGEHFGGSLARRDSYTDSKWMRLQAPPHDLMRLVVRVGGDWALDGVEFPGYFAANVEYNWRSTYGDIEFDGFYSGETGTDLTDAFWDCGELSRLVNGYIERMKDFSGAVHQLKTIFFTPSPSADHQLALARALYSKDINEFFWSTIRSLRESEDWQRNGLEERAAPYQDQFLINSIRKSEVTDQKLGRSFQRYGIEVHEGSIVYVGRRKDSFEHVYGDFTKSIIIPALSVLPARGELQRKITRALDNVKPLDTTS